MEKHLPIVTYLIAGLNSRSLISPCNKSWSCKLLQNRKVLGTEDVYTESQQRHGGGRSCKVFHPGQCTSWPVRQHGNPSNKAHTHPRESTIEFYYFIIELVLESRHSLLINERNLNRSIMFTELTWKYIDLNRTSFFPLCPFQASVLQIEQSVIWEVF